MLVIGCGTPVSQHALWWSEDSFVVSHLHDFQGLNSVSRLVLKMPLAAKSSCQPLYLFLKCCILCDSYRSTDLVGVRGYEDGIANRVSGFEQFCKGAIGSVDALRKFRKELLGEVIRDIGICLQPAQSSTCRASPRLYLHGQ